MVEKFKYVGECAHANMIKHLKHNKLQEEGWMQIENMVDESFNITLCQHNKCMQQQIVVKQSFEKKELKLTLNPFPCLIQKQWKGYTA